MSISIAEVETLTSTKTPVSSGRYSRVYLKDNSAILVTPQEDITKEVLLTLQDCENIHIPKIRKIGTTSSGSNVYESEKYFPMGDYDYDNFNTIMIDIYYEGFQKGKFLTPLRESRYLKPDMKEAIRLIYKAMKKAKAGKVEWDFSENNVMVDINGNIILNDVFTFV